MSGSRAIKRNAFNHTPRTAPLVQYISVPYAHKVVMSSAVSANHSRSEQKSRKLCFGYICVIYEGAQLAEHTVTGTNVWSAIKKKLVFSLCPSHTTSLSSHTESDKFLVFAISCAPLPHVERNLFLISFFLLIFFPFSFSSCPPLPTPSPFLFFLSIPWSPPHVRRRSWKITCHICHLSRSLMNSFDLSLLCLWPLSSKKSRSRKCLHQRVNSLTCGSVTKL